MNPIVVTPIDGSPTMFTASSRSRDMEHQIDMAHWDEGAKYARPVCHCEDCFCKGFKWCAHLQAVVEYLCGYRAEVDEHQGRNEDDPRLEER